ncbi:sulfurtransferase TusA family protein [bacterium]|nr:sulfurtransferase TusA family protein [bacterium]
MRVVEVNALGLLCPLPVIRLAKAILGLEEGEVAEVLSDDPMASLDIEAWCQGEGHLYLGLVVENPPRFRIRVGGGEREA